jgi:hypothetical protein
MPNSFPLSLLAVLLVGGVASTANAAPLVLPETKLLAADGTPNDHFGMAVAVSGDIAVIGAEGDGTKHGAVYVFVRGGATWSLQQELVAADGANGDEFGHAVAVDGNTVIIGAYGDDDNKDLSGSAYIFERGANGWSQQQKLLAAGGFAGDEFGISVAVSGGTVLIGAFERDDNGTSSGAAYVFSRSGTTWTQQQKLLAADGAANDQFGASVALQGDTALIGAYGDSDNGTSSGSAYVFTRNGGLFAQAQKLVAPDGASRAFFGASVALDGGIAVIGAFGDSQLANMAGAAYVFTGSGATWSEAQKLLAADGVAEDLFGYSVAVRQHVALVGAYQRDDNGVDSGAVYLFQRGFGTFTEQQKILAPNGAAFNWFGWSVAVDDSPSLVALAGAYGDSAKGSFAGSAEVFTQPVPLPVPALGAGLGRRFGLALGLLLAGLIALGRGTRYKPASSG